MQLPEIKGFTAERIYVHAARGIDRPVIAALREPRLVIKQHERICGELMIELESYIHGMVRERLIIHRKWPKTWWDAFKERWFPGWAKSRWPVEYERIDVDERLYAAVCPHLQDDPQKVHLEWMAAELERVR